MALIRYTREDILSLAKRIEDRGRLSLRINGQGIDLVAAAQILRLAVASGFPVTSVEVDMGDGR